MNDNEEVFHVKRSIMGKEILIFKTCVYNIMHTLQEFTALHGKKKLPRKDTNIY